MIWNDLGYTGKLYFIEPLSIDSQGNNLLCGRDFEIEVFLNDCFNDNKCLKVISGDVGIGKTSFVNACQFICYNPRDFKVSKVLEGRILPSYKKIELSNHDNINSFSIKAVISLTTNINSHFIESGAKIPDSIKEYIDYWNKIRLKTSSGGLSVGVTVFGSGGNVDRQLNTYEAQEIRDPITAFNNLLSYILNETDISGVFMFVDNLDTVDNKSIIRVLNEVRDSYFTLDNVYWLLVGQKGLGELINGGSRRLGGYLTGVEISLSKLEPKMFLAAVQEREKIFKISNNIDFQKFKEKRKKIAESKKVKKAPDYRIYPPLDEETHMMIYEFAHFELREAFKICSDITIRAQEDIKAYGQLFLRNAFNHLVEYCDTITSFIDSFDDNKDILSQIYKSNEINNSCYQNHGYKSASGFETVLRNFANNGLLLPKTIGKKKFYETSWRLEAMALCDLLNRDCTELV